MGKPEVSDAFIDGGLPHNSVILDKAGSGQDKPIDAYHR